MTEINQTAIQKAYDDVENVLKSFPEDCQKNYFENKKDLKIVFEEVILESISGNYYHEENIITLYDISAIHHELFHMAARDRTKLNKKVFSDSDELYHNGLSFRNNDRIILKGITEGFIEYLTRKSTKSKGHELIYYFVDLLISIHGEEIIYYVLKNDPINFYQDERFYDIILFTKYIDKLEVALKAMQLLRIDEEDIEKAFKKNDIKEIKKFKEIINETEKNFKKSIVELFKIIINEFKHCNQSKINLNDFITKLNVFLTDPDYKFVFELDDVGRRCIKNEITTIIQDFSNDNYQNSSKITKSKVYKNEKKVI